MDNYQQLWQEVQQVVPGSVLQPATLQLELEQYRNKLLNLFQNKGPQQSLRQQVAQGRVQTPNFGEVALDYDPDQLRVTELTDKLRLDEVTCVELLTFAQEMWGLASLEAAFGVHLAERLDAAKALSRLLTLQLVHQLEVGTAGEAEDLDLDAGGAAGNGISVSLAGLMEQQPLLGVVVRFNESLLREVHNGRNQLISRLIEVIKDHTLDSLGQSFPIALDRYGGAANSTYYINQERCELCKALLYAVVLSPVPLTATSLSELLQLLEGMAAKVKASGPNASHSLIQQVTSCLLAVVAGLSLGNAAGGAPRPSAAIAQLLRAPELQPHLQQVAKAEDSFAAVVALAWALTREALSSNRAGSINNTGVGALSPSSGAGSNTDAGGAAATPSALLEAAGKARALGMLAGLLNSVAFQLEEEEGHKHLCARMVYRLLTEMLEFDVANKRELTETLIKASKQHMEKGTSSRATAPMLPLPPPAATAAAAPGIPANTQSMALVPFGTSAAPPGQQAWGHGHHGHGGQQQAGRDDLSSLLDALAAVFRVRPGLWYDGEAPEAYPHVSSFMSYVAVHPAMQIPDVRVSFLDIMTSLAAGPRGSRFILLQFRTNAASSELEHFTWRKLFQSVVAYCRRYEDLEREAAAAGATVMATGLLAARDDALMAHGDAALLVAYLELLSKVIDEGAEEEVRAALQALEREVSPVLGGLPLYEPLFQLMCHGVPSAVKAAVNRTLAALGRFKELAPRLLERLLMAAVVSTPQSAMEGYAGLPRFDLVAQINEVEARQEEYGETLAFLQLVNRLITTLGPTGLPAGGAAVSHYTQLVLQYVVAHLWQRGYRDPAQKWHLAAACFKHCQLALAALATCPPLTPELLARPPPGLAVLLSLMGGRQLERALLQHVLQPGWEELAASMEAGNEGLPRQAAALEGLKLLNAALEVDQQAAEQLAALGARERPTPLHQQLINPQRRLAVMLQYVMYPDTSIQLEAVKLLSQLSARLPNIVALLQPNFDDTAAIAVCQGFAQTLELALLDPAAGESVTSGVMAMKDAAGGADSDGSRSSSASDMRAELLLDVMLGTLRSYPAPCLGHLLLGFDTTAPPSDWYRHSLATQLDFTCMTVLLRVLQVAGLQQEKPVLYAKCLQLLYTIAADPLTTEPVFRLLHPQEPTGVLLPGLAPLLLEPLPAVAGDSDKAVHAQVASLRQRGFLLELYALTLLRCNDNSMLEPVISSLLEPASQDAILSATSPNRYGGRGDGRFQQGSAAGFGPYSTSSPPAALVSLQLIREAVSLHEPSLKDLPSELLQLQQDMVVDDISVAALLSQTAAMEQCGVVALDDNGQAVFDFAVLQQLLHERYEEYVSKTGGRGGPGDKLARDAVVAAFMYAQQVNAHALLTGAQKAAALAWIHAIEMTFAKCYPLVNSRVCPGCGPELLHSFLLGVLAIIKILAARHSSELAELLANSCRVLLGKLQELASSSLSLGLPGDPLSQVRLPVRCLALLRLLLDCLLGSGSHRGLRCEMYVALLQYLHFCRGSKLSSCPPLVLSCLLAAAGPGTSAAQLDALQQQLEEINGRTLRPLVPDLVSLMVGDVLQPPEQGGTGQAIALHLVAALVSADAGSTALADALHRADVPRVLLESVANNAPHILLQPAQKSEQALRVIAAQLSLLLALASAGSPAARKGSIKAVADAGALPYLTACKALDFTPEQPSTHRRLQKSGALRYRLVHLVCPVLRLVLALLAGTPGSSGLAQQTAAFAVAHQDMMARIMQEAASPATPAWQPGDEELEQAALAVSLLAALPGALSPRGPLAGFRRDMWRLWLMLCGHDSRQGGIPVSSIVAQLRLAGSMDGPVAASNRAHQERRRSQLLQLRCGLASCLRDAVTPGAVGATASSGTDDAAGAELLICVGHQAQTTVDAMGRPTLLLIRDTADQALQDTLSLSEDLEDLLTFLQTPDSLTTNAAVTQKLVDWGPGLSGLSALNPANPAERTAAEGLNDSATSGNPRGAADNRALVVAGSTPNDHRSSSAAATAAAAAAGGFGGLDPAAARRLARQCAANAASVLLGQLSNQLNLLEQCLAVVLLHFVQCLPRPDTAAAMAVTKAAGGDDTDAMLLDGTAAQAGSGSLALTGVDNLLHSPGPKAAAKLGSISDLQFFAGKMRDVCLGSDEAVSRVRTVLEVAAEEGAAGVSGSGPVGGEVYSESLESVELLNRQLKAYLASL